MKLTKSQLREIVRKEVEETVKIEEISFTDNGKKKLRNISWDLQKYAEALEKAAHNNDVREVVNIIATIKKTLKLLDKGWKFLVTENK